VTLPILRVSAPFAPHTITKVEHLLELLAEIHERQYLKPRLALHGGTALNLFHLDLPRLSVDIDLLYVGDPSREGMLAERPRVRQELEDLFRKLGYRYAEPRDEHAGVTYKLVFRTAWGEDMIKVDLNFLNRAPLLGFVPRTCRHCEPTVTFNVIAFPELVAGKVKALAERRSAAIRDLYDLYQVAGLPLEDRALLKALIIYYWALADTFPRVLDGAIVDRFADAGPALESELFPVLHPNDRIQLETMIEKVGAFLGRFADLEPEEAKFLDLLASEGDYQPELLFDRWPEVLKRARISPAAAWKVKNLGRRPGSTPPKDNLPD